MTIDEVNELDWAFALQQLIELPLICRFRSAKVEL